MTYTYPEKIILGVLVLILFIIGLLPIIKSAPAPHIFSQNTDFFLIDINAASVEELKVIPYMSNSIIQEIIRYRLSKGRINSTDELLSVKGIGPAKLKRMRKYLRF
jgi:competence protein ComEA